MNYQEIISELINQGINESGFAYGDIDNPLVNIGAWKELEQHGGEGEGSNWYSVKHFIDHDVYIKTSGFYASYSGTDFDGDIADCSAEVKPKEKTITVYE